MESESKSFLQPRSVGRVPLRLRAPQRFDARVLRRRRARPRQPARQRRAERVRRVQTFKLRYLYFHLGLAEGQSIKISSTYPNIKLLSKYQNIGCIETDFLRPRRKFSAFFRILPEFGEFRQNSGNIWSTFSKIPAKLKI